MADRLPNVQFIYWDWSARSVNESSGGETFIHDNKVERSEFGRLVVYALDSGHNDGFFRLPGFQPRGIDSDRHFGAEFPDFVRILFKQFLDMGKDEHASVPYLNGIFGYLGQDQTFPGSRGKHDARIVVVLTEIAVNRVHRLLLVITQVQNIPPFGS